MEVSFANLSRLEEVVFLFDIAFFTRNRPTSKLERNFLYKHEKAKGLLRNQCWIS
jgi:hypothetical protein